MSYPKLIGLFFSCFILISFQLQAKSPKIIVGVFEEHCADTELQAIKNEFRDNPVISIKFISFKGFSAKSLNNVNAIWYHRTDRLPFTSSELKAGDIIKKFVSDGGSLFLTMESFPLLNNWGIEKTRVEMQTDTIVDNGFGRPLGFHAFKDHPVFNGLLGGVYTSKQKKDHIARKFGFFGSTIPENGKTIGIQWTYITFWEKNKLLLEYSLGKGKIIAAGAFIYFATENYQQRHLKKFTENVFLYASGRISSSNTYYWNYTPPTIEERDFSTNNLAPIPSEKWVLPKPTLSFHQPKATNDFFDLVGRKILWMGKVNSGIDEIWMHPFMSLRDFNAGVRIKGYDSVFWLKNIQASATITPEFLVREYGLKNSRIKEVQTVSFDKPLGVVHFEIEGDDVKELVIDFRSNLRYMWPYNSTATESIFYQFNEQINGHIISGQNGELNTVVTYSDHPASQSIKSNQEKNAVLVNAGFKIIKNRSVNIYISGSTESYIDAIENISGSGESLSTLFLTSNDYYKKLLQDHLTIETPDQNFNQGYRWALARTDQFLQTTPGIGTSLMAGFGTTGRGWNGNQEINGRPGYAWYFGRDAVWSAMAINAYGNFDMVKEVLETFIRYQDLNGKIYHELTSSGVAHYDAADATPLFVILAGHYLKYSGDIDFIKSIWPFLKKAIDYCQSTDTDGDGLIENTNVGHGWIEGGPLFGTHTEFYLAGTWAATLDAASYISVRLNMSQQSKIYAQKARIVKEIIDRDFWNPDQNFFYVGKMLDGSYLKHVTGYSTVPVYLNAVNDKNKIFKVNERLSSKYFTSDWGLRMLEDTSRIYNPGSYHSGMVWPLYSGWASLSEFRSGHNISGFMHIMNNLLVYKHWAPGSIEETLNGSIYKPNGVCHHQCWSETMVLLPAIEGMLGLVPDAQSNTMKLSPFFPWDWDTATVKNIRVKNTLINLALKRDSLKTTYNISSSDKINIHFEPRFPLGSKINKISVRGNAIPFSSEVLANCIQLSLDLSVKEGLETIQIDHSVGVGFIPTIADPVPGDSSTGYQFISEKFDNGIYVVNLQGLPGSPAEIKIFSTKKPSKVDGAEVTAIRENVIYLKTIFPGKAKEKYTNKEVVLFFQKE